MIPCSQFGVSAAKRGRGEEQKETEKDKTGREGEKKVKDGRIKMEEGHVPLRTHRLSLFH